MKIRRFNRTNNSKRFAIKKRSLITLFGATLIVLNVFFTLQMASLGVRVADLERVLTNLEKENADLETKLVDSSSLLHLQEKSTQLGYSKPEESLFIKGEAEYTGMLH